MKFVFRMSGYDDPALDKETVALLEQRLEAKSRQVMPGVWSVTDKLNAYAAKGPGRESRRKRYQAYGGILVTLGALALITGLREPRTESLIWAGGFAIFCGILEFLSIRKRKPHIPPAACQNEAIALLEKLRSADWSAPEKRTELRFDEEEFSVTVDDQTESTPYGDVTGIFETEHAWLLVYGEEQAVLLQKKDLIEGDVEKFRPYLQENITK